MGKHTLGPWKIMEPNPDKIDANQRYDRMIVGPQNEHIAELFQVMVPPGSKDAPPENQSVINARLIAAAPEMYEALEWMLYVAHDIGKAGGKPEAGEYEAAFDSGKAALAKAEGA